MSNVKVTNLLHGSSASNNITLASDGTTTIPTVKATTQVLVGGVSSTANGGTLQISNGITFPATQSACSDVNTLDDYEEGTWTPVYSFSTSGDATVVSNGRYIKVGSLVYVQAYLYINSSSSLSGDALISGLPFASSNSTQRRYGFSIGEARRFATDMPNLRLLLEPNASALKMFNNATNSFSESRLTSSNFTASAEYNMLTFSGSYTV